MYVTDPGFPLRFMVRAWAINRWGKISVRNLQYGPRTRLVRGICFFPEEKGMSQYRLATCLSFRSAAVN